MSKPFYFRKAAIAECAALIVTLAYESSKEAIFGGIKILVTGRTDTLTNQERSLPL